MKHLRTFFIAILCMVAGSANTAWADQTWTVTNADNVFTISRTETTTAETVKYRTVSLSANDKTVLYLGAENTLYYPSADMAIGSCRAYFELGNGLTIGDPESPVKAFNLSFSNDDDATRLNEELRMKSDESDDAIYNLSGQRLQKMQKGINIVNGKKILK